MGQVLKVLIMITVVAVTCAQLDEQPGGHQVAAASGGHTVRDTRGGVCCGRCSPRPHPLLRWLGPYCTDLLTGSASPGPVLPHHTGWALGVLVDHFSFFLTIVLVYCALQFFI